MALAYAREGADVAIAYLNEHKDAEVCCWGLAPPEFLLRVVNTSMML